MRTCREPASKWFWSDRDARQWEALLGLCARPSLQQSWAYGEAACAQGHTVRRGVFKRGEELLAFAQLIERRGIGPLRPELLLGGPLWLLPSPTDDLERRALGGLRNGRLGRALLWSPAEGPASRRRAGLFRVMTGYSTGRLDLQPELDVLRRRLQGKWRNRLRRAEDACLEIVAQAQGPLLAWLIERNEGHRRKVGYRGATPAFLYALARADSGLIMVAREHGAPLAGIMIQRHGRTATYVAGYTSQRGRERHATHLLLWKAVERLRGEGVAALDLGILDTVNAAGLTRFKLGLGAACVTTPGTYFMPPKLLA